ncbi:hypothetical protein HDU98_010115 [Podochytrium sp. JEL0797]|nr:hypothetical protein HDU98_010115 [Podochytrium sp. JEL0797]
MDSNTTHSRSSTNTPSGLTRNLGSTKRAGAAAAPTVASSLRNSQKPSTASFMDPNASQPPNNATGSSIRSSAVPISSLHDSISNVPSQLSFQQHSVASNRSSLLMSVTSASGRETRLEDDDAFSESMMMDNPVALGGAVFTLSAGGLIESPKASSLSLDRRNETAREEEEEENTPTKHNPSALARVLQQDEKDEHRPVSWGPDGIAQRSKVKHEIIKSLSVQTTESLSLNKKPSSQSMYRGGSPRMRSDTPSERGASSLMGDKNSPSRVFSADAFPVFGSTTTWKLDLDGGVGGAGEKENLLGRLNLITLWTKQTPLPSMKNTAREWRFMLRVAQLALTMTNVNLAKNSSIACERNSAYCVPWDMCLFLAYVCAAAYCAMAVLGIMDLRTHAWGAVCDDRAVEARGGWVQAKVLRKSKDGVEMLVDEFED